MSGTVSGTQTLAITLSSDLYSNPVTVFGNVDVDSGNAIIALAAWTISNIGSISAFDGDSVYLDAGGVFENAGWISATSYGLISTSGHSFTIQNTESGTIAGNGVDAVKLGGNVLSSTFVNEGRVVDTNVDGSGVQLDASSATNGLTGAIQGGSVGVNLGNASQFLNLGTVTGVTGILVAVGQNSVTIIDAGLVSASGGDAISFAAGAVASVTDALTLLPGAVLDGQASGGAIADVVFAGVGQGTLVDIGEALTHFVAMSLAQGADWEFSGTSTIDTPFENDGTIIERSGDNLTFQSALTGDGTIDLAGGLLTFANLADAGQFVTFATSESSLVFNQAHPFAGTIAGFGVGDTIDVTGFGSSEIVTGTVSGNVLTLVDGMAPLTLTFASDPGALVVEPIGGTNPKTYQILAPCFRAGTRLLAPGGLRAVETLRKGDFLIAHNGAVRRIIWCGHRRVNCARHPNPEAVLPVLVEAGAFGLGVPSRDLYLSPDHAVYCNNVLIQVKYLINGVSVRQVAVREVVYHHVELESHDIVWAETLPAETYLDCGNRYQFAGRSGAVSLHADFAPPHWDAARACAPMVCDGDILRELRVKLHRIVETNGGSLAPGTFTVFVDGRQFAPGDSKTGHKRYILPTGARTLTIRSTAAAPAELDPTSLDRRRLGIAVTAVLLNGMPITPDDQRFEKGFYAPEPLDCLSDWFRWTDGMAAFDVTGVWDVAFTVQAVASTWHVPDERRQTEIAL